MFRIGEFSKLSRTTVKTLRYYDEIGLLKPEATDPWSGYRLYTTDQLFQLHRIQSLRQAGLSVDETRMILDGNSADEILRSRRAELHAELVRNQDQLSRIEFMLQGHAEESFMNYVATIKELPACIVYSRKATVARYSDFMTLIPAIGAEVSAKYPDLKCTSPEYCFMVYLDREYREQDIHVEFCEAVEQMKPDFGDYHFQRLDPITALSIFHKGPYAGLGEAYAYAFQWIEENGYRCCGPCRESYIDGIWNKELEADWLTEIQIPVAKKP